MDRPARRFYAARGHWGDGGPPDPAEEHVFDPSPVSSLVAALTARDASLWHDCGLADFAGYVALGAIGTGADLERITGVPRVDGATGPDDQVLLRPRDQGREFARGRSLLPGPAGPITLQLHPRVLERGSMSAPTQAERLLAAVEAGRADGDGLALVLQPGHRIPLPDVVAVWVDPVAMGELQLLDLVDALVDAGTQALRVRRRTRVEPDRLDVWHDLARVLGDGEQPLLAVWRRADTSAAFRAWADTLRADGRDAPFARFAAAFYEGTLRPLRDVVVARRAAVGTGLPAHVGTPAGGERAAVARGGFPPGPRPISVRACGHPRLAWAAGACPVCLRDERSRWRYPEPA